jgi:hypothetical protein
MPWAKLTEEPAIGRLTVSNAAASMVLKQKGLRLVMKTSLKAVFKESHDNDWPQQGFHAADWSRELICT